MLVRILNKIFQLLFFLSCDANHFDISHSQRRVVQMMNRFINDDIKPDNKTSTAVSNKTNSMTLKQWMQQTPKTNATQLMEHILTKDTRELN